jgi:hypothetical protein
MWKNMEDDLEARSRKFRYCVNASAVGLTAAEIKGQREIYKMTTCEDVSGEGTGGKKKRVLMAMEAMIDHLGAEGKGQRRPEE